MALVWATSSIQRGAVHYGHSADIYGGKMSHFELFWSSFWGFLGVIWSPWHVEAHISSIRHPWRRPLEPLELLSISPRNVVCDVGLGSHGALWGVCEGLQPASVSWTNQSQVCVCVLYSRPKERRMPKIVTVFPVPWLPEYEHTLVVSRPSPLPGLLHIPHMWSQSQMSQVFLHTFYRGESENKVKITSEDSV